jgi:hypothetical protein
MVTLLASLIGFLSATFPDVLRLFRDHQDRLHELKILDLQLKQQAQGHTQKLEEIRSTADIAESRALYRTYYSGIRWVDALNGTVRPVLAYAFFLLYALVKLYQLTLLSHQPELPWRSNELLLALWNEEDRAIFAGIISFYFGQRAMAKARN